MRFKTVISLPAALVLTACISSVNMVEEKIVFNPVIGNEVRSSDMSVPFPEDNTFGVWALDSRTSAMYMDDCEIRHADGGWTSDPVTFWPVSTPLSFMAYSPYSLPMTLEGVNLVLKDFDVSKDDTDILFTLPVYGLTSALGAVKIPFMHALSKLDMRVANGFGDDVDLRIDAVLIKGVARRGDFTTARKSYWIVDESSLEDIVIFDSERDGEFLAGPRMQFIGEVHTIIPQGMRPTVVLSYSFRVDGGEWIDGQQESVELRDTYWEAGRYYTYSFNINESRLTYTTGIGHWSERN